MNSQISNISTVIEDIKELITDTQYKTILDNLMQIHNNNNIVIPNNTPTTERDITASRLTDEQIENLKNVRIKVAEIKQQMKQRNNQ